MQVEIDSKEDYRNLEIKYNIRLLNILARNILIDKWNPLASDEAHKKRKEYLDLGQLWFGSRCSEMLFITN